MKNSIAGSTLVMLCTQLSACVDETPGANEPGSTGQLSATLSTGSVHDVTAVRFRIVSAAQTCADEPLTERTVPLRPESRSIPEPADAGTAYPFADTRFVLRSGDYRICAQPLKADATESAECGLAQTTANVFPKVTTEVTLVSQCKGDAKGGLGITTILNSPPHIDDLTIEPSSPTPCDKAKLTVTATDPNGDAVSYAWQLTRGDGILSPSDNTATLEPSVAGNYEVRVTVEDTHDAATSLNIPLYVSPGACGADAGAEAEAGTDSQGDAGQQGPARWLSYVVQGAGAVDELWAVRISDGIPGAPIRVNAPLAPGQQISWTGWGGDGSHLAYRIGTDDLFIVEMTGPVPGTPKVLTNVPSFSWSPNGRYLARVEQNPTTSTFKVAVVDLSDPGLVWRYSPDEIYYDIRDFSWSANSGWVFGLAPATFLWSVRVTPAGPEALSGQPGGWIEPMGFWPSPVGAEFAVLVHYGASGGKYALALGDPSGYGIVTSAWGFFPDVHTEFRGFLPNGDLAYWGQSPGEDLSTVCPGLNLNWSCPIHLLNDCGHLRVFAVPSTPDHVPEGWQAAPDGRTVAVHVREADVDAADPWLESLQVVYLWKRDPQTCWAPAIKATVAVWPPQRYSVLTDWAPDSRTLLVRYAKYAIINTQGTPPFSPIELSLPDVAYTLRWGRSSMRLFYHVDAPKALGYVDLRTGTPALPTTVSPPFAHSAGDSIDWALSSGDDYVAMRDDFVQDGRYELYVTDLRGASPSEPLKVHTQIGESQSVTTFAWQPAVGSP